MKFIGKLLSPATLPALGILLGLAGILILFSAPAAVPVFADGNGSPADCEGTTGTVNASGGEESADGEPRRHRHRHNDLHQERQ